MTSQIWVMVSIFLATQFLLIAGVMIRFWINTSTKLKELEVRLTLVEADHKTIIRKIDSVLESVHLIQLSLQNKKDRDS